MSDPETKRRKLSNSPSQNNHATTASDGPPLMKLSNELIARIIDSLHDDPRSLKHCSLTCQLFLPRARHNLFHVVHLHARNCQRFMKILEASPGVGAHVKELHVTVNTRESPPWVDKYLPSAAEKMPNVDHLFIKGKAVYKAAPLLGFRAVRRLDISGCEIESTNAFLTLLGSFPKLETVYTNEMIIYRPNDSDGPPPDLHPPPTFKAITWNSCRADPDFIPDWMIAKLFHAKLEYIAICPLQDVGMPGLGRLMRACGPALKHFKAALVGMKERGGFADLMKPTGFNMSENPNLLTLEFCSPAAFAKMYEADDLSFAWFPVMLKSVSSPYIEEVAFYLWDEDLEALSSDAWDEIPRILATRQFSSLKRVVFHVWGKDAETRTIREIIRRKFESFEGRGVLRIDAKSDPACE